VSAARARDVFVQALRLGASSFGGPIAHLGYFERTYVRELGWLGAADYASLVALCQVLPGPASSQVGFLIGMRRAGWLGGLAAWLGFTLPSAVAMYAFARLAPSLRAPPALAALHGLKLAAVAVVGQAVWKMALRLNADLPRAAIGVLAAAAMLLVHGAAAQIAVLIGGAMLGLILCRNAQWELAPLADAVGPRAAGAVFAIFLGALLLLPLAAARAPHGWAAFADAFYRAGALVFGGGHVVLPLLRDALVPAWLSDETFLAGYGAAQVVPGPLFTFSAYLGASPNAPGGGLAGAAVALIAIFLPGLLLAAAGLRMLRRLQAMPGAPGALAGVNAAVVGLLGAAWYDPVWTASVADALDAAIALAGFVALERGLAPIVAVAFCVAAALLRQALG
jgi:chromate transporter